MIRISVVVPFYNAQQYISHCIEGLLAQDYPAGDYEIVTVDNNSKDSSAGIVKGYPRVKLVSEEKQGSYAARNRGLREAKGEIIAFTDPDCIPSGNWLREIEAVMSDPRVGIVLGSHQLGNDSFLLSMLKDYENEKHDYIFSSRVVEICYGYTNNMAIRRTLFDQIGPFVERQRGSDVIFVRRSVDAFSWDVIRYSAEVRVRHLEIDTLVKYFRKVFIYGGSLQKYSRIVHVRSLNRAERLLIFRKTVRTQKYSWVKSIVLFGLLTIGFMYWTVGSIRVSRLRQNPAL